MRNLLFLTISRELDDVKLKAFDVSDDLSDRVTVDSLVSDNPISINVSLKEIVISFDHFNSLPLFWVETVSGDVVVSNRYDKVLEFAESKTLDEIGFWELYLFESPLLSRTLYKEVSVSQAGHDLVVSKGTVTLKRRISFAYGKKENSVDLIDRAHNVLSMNLRAQYENAIFPISGGVDSRLILSYVNENLKNDTQFVTYGFSPKVYENFYAKSILRALYGKGFNHTFHTVQSENYLDSGVAGLEISGSLAGIQNSHLLGYAKKLGVSGQPCIMGMFADAIFGYGATENKSDWTDCNYTKKAMGFMQKKIISKVVYEGIVDDIKILFDDWMKESDISSFDEYIYIRERNGKFHTQLMNLLQDYWDVKAPLNQKEIIEFFMSLPFELRKNKRIVDKLLEGYFPKVSSIKNVSSSFRHSNGYFLYKACKLANDILLRKLGILPVIPIYSDTERHDFSFNLLYRNRYLKSIDKLADELNLDTIAIGALQKYRSGMHGFQFISNANLLLNTKA